MRYGDSVPITSVQYKLLIRISRLLTAPARYRYEETQISRAGTGKFTPRLSHQKGSLIPPPGSRYRQACYPLIFSHGHLPILSQHTQILPRFRKPPKWVVNIVNNEVSLLFGRVFFFKDIIWYYFF